MARDIFGMDEQQIPGICSKPGIYIPNNVTQGKDNPNLPDKAGKDLYQAAKI